MECITSKFIPLKFLILTLSFLREIQIIQERSTECGIRIKTKSEIGSLKTVDQFSHVDASIIHEKLANLFNNFLVLGELTILNLFSIRCGLHMSSY